MSQTLKITNYSSLNLVEPTSLLDAISAGTSSVPVQNNQNFVADSFFILGRLSSETSEILSVASTIGSSTLVTKTPTLRNHSKGEAIHMLYGDKLRIHRAPNVNGTPPADNTYVQIAEIDIDYDQSSTSYTDTSGSSAYWYKSTYYNSSVDAETSLVSSSALRGGGYGNYATLDSIRGQAGLQGNRYITDAKIEEKRQAAQSFINSTLTGRYTVPFVSPINPLIAEITRLLAAGYLLTQEVGVTSGSTYAEGQGMIDRVTNEKKTGLLDKLNVGTLTLVGANGDTQEVSTDSGGGNYSGWATEKTKSTAGADGGGERMFRVSDRY